MKLPKSVDLNATPIVDCPEKGGLFVVMAKTGAAEAPKPVQDRHTGRGPRVFTQNGVAIDPATMLPKSSP